jgi:hypothetical protein
MRRVFVCIAAVSALSVGALSARGRQAQETPAAQAPPAASTPSAADDENWKPTEIKNLTVLPKDTSVDDVMKIMRGWDEALNVECVFCHVGQIGKPLSTFDFASDDKKRKEVSRVMLQGVMDMNEKFTTLGDDAPQVACSTCHKRSRHVEDELPPPKPREEPHQ